MKRFKLVFPLLAIMALGFTSCKKANITPTKNIKIWNRGEIASENRSGVQLTLAFDETKLEFSGTLVNNNNSLATNARVEVHTFDPNGTAMFEYGPSTPTDMQPGETLNIVLPALNAGNFSTFSMHSEIGTQAGSGG